jgi:hypothetical protein
MAVPQNETTITISKRNTRIERNVACLTKVIQGESTILVGVGDVVLERSDGIRVSGTAPIVSSSLIFSKEK